MRRCAVFLCLLLPAGGCATVEGQLAGVEIEPSPQLLYVQDVPFHPQTDYQCGPASLAAVLNYWGRPVTPEMIAQDIYRPEMNGTLSLDLWHYAKAQDLRATIRRGSWDLLESQVRRNRPVIALLNLGLQQVPIGHFLVVVGVDPQDKSVIAHSGVKKNQRIPFDRFRAAWERTNYWALLIEPGEGAREGT